MRRRSRVGISLIEVAIVLTIIGILLAVVGPKLTEILSGAKHSAVLQHIRAIHMAQATYYSKFGRFAESLAQLGPPPAASERGPQAAGLLPPDLAAGERTGYRYALAPSGEGHALTATPSPARGERSYYSDGTMIVRHAPCTQMATVESPMVN
ncbi:MAG: type II secretion system protein [Acidobacteria bacterium]|nr:type II secretion system protein [Acidobacteriota bacterium]